MNGIAYVVAAYSFVAVLFGSWVGIMLRRNAHRARETTHPTHPDERG